MRASSLLTVILTAAAATAQAQDPMAGSEPVFIQALPATCVHMAGAGAASAPRVVKNAPYSASGRSETVRMLADGNRIVHSNTIRYFRDGRGRTRTEYNLSALGPIALSASSSLAVIDDPEAGKRFVLHPQQKIVTEMPLAQCGPPGAEPAIMPFTAGVPVPPPGTGEVDVLMAAPARDATSSTLPERTIKGLRAMGKRTEFAIPAGQIGNELPITVRSETWYSPELQVVLAASHRDPLVGDTSYQLVDVVRQEPDAKLFTVPADYTARPLPPMFDFEVSASPDNGSQSRPDAARKPNRSN